MLAPRGGGRPRSERREYSPFPPAQGHACALNNSGPGPVPSPKVRRVAARIMPLKDNNKINNGNQCSLGNKER